MAAIQLTGIRVVVFDLDDTLYPEQAFVFSGFKAVADWLLRRAACPFDPAARMRQIFTNGDRRHVFDQVLEELNYGDAQSMIQSMVETYRNHRPEIRLFPDAEHVLRLWKNQFQLALISDGPWQMQKNKVEALGLPGRLDPILLTAQWGEEYAKPHPYSFELVQQTTGRQGSACVYLADNVSKDFIAPRLLGWRTVRIRREDGIYAALEPPIEGQPEFEVTNLKQISLSY